MGNDAALTRRIERGGGGRRRASLEGYEMIEENMPHNHPSVLAMTTRGGGGDDWVENTSSTTSIDGDDVEQQQDKLRGRLILLLVAFLYGTLNVVLRQLYATPGPPSASMLSATRGWLAAACFLPAIPQIQSEARKTSAEGSGVNFDSEKQAPLVMVALELAWWNFATQGLVNVGLLFTESARASFLTQTSVVITPLISMMQGNRVGRNVWIGCAAALAGLALLSTEGGDAVSSASEGVASGIIGSSI